MKACEGQTGRVFVIRLEDGDVVPDCLERFAGEKGISTGHVVLIGGIGGGEVVVGPRDSDESPPEPMLLPVDGAHEVAGLGIIAPTITGCLRPGVTTWLVGEAIIYEITGTSAARLPDKESGFNLLEVGFAQK